MPVDHPTPNEVFADLAARLGVRKQDLLVLSTRRDPFNVGSPAQIRDAEWFANAYYRLGLPDGEHVRQIHYEFLSARLEMPDGRLYGHSTDPAETSRMWKWLKDAAVWARWLNLVSFMSIEDNRSGDPTTIEDMFGTEETPSSTFTPGGLIIPRFSPAESYDPEIDIDGYAPHPLHRGPRAVLVVEKVSALGELAPVCERWGVEIVPGVGTASVTTPHRILDRAVASGVREVCILYVADHDTKGLEMSRSMGRHLQKFLSHGGAFAAPDLEVKLDRLAIRPEHIARFGLPVAPDPGRSGDRVEMEAILTRAHAGTLAALLEARLTALIDLDDDERMRRAADDAATSVREEWESLAGDETLRLEELQEQLNEIIGPHLVAAKEEAADVLVEIDAAEREINALAASFEPHLPEPPTPCEAGDDGFDWLYDSTRGFGTQTAVFQRDKAAT